MKKLLTLSFLLGWSGIVYCQPVNDDCSGLIDLGEAPICPIPDTFNNVNATTSVVFSDPLENIPACFTGGVVNRDVWFSFTVPGNGSIVDFTVIITAVNGPNGGMVQPQVAVYRGDCLLDELQELDCATSFLGETEVEIDLLGLTPGLPYFLRISDWSASATPNWGDFVLCVKEYDPVFNMGQEDFTESCAGTLFDSGGPTGDYGNNEDLTFTICSQDFHQCIFINVTSFELENGFDFLNFFSGPNINSPGLTQLTGTGANVEIQVHSECVTIQFDSDVSVTDPGFELSWQCTPDTCTIPPPVTCDNPTIISSLPYSANDLTTCFSGNEISQSPCNNDDFLETEDYIFAYESPGDECIAVSITGSNSATGVGIYNDCPNFATECIGQAGGGFGQSDPAINAAFLEFPGTYYIVVDNASNCTPFNITVEQVTCPVVFPSAALCEDALSLNGCGELPAIISVAPGQGEDGFLQTGVNLGCWGAFFPLNFTWFFFQAQADGEFGFVLQAADPNEASDVDFQVWGPFDDPAGACDYAMNNQPIRSSYAAGADPTGLVNIHPTLGTPVTDVCENAGGDDFVATIQVQQGEYYFVLVNDWGEQITSGAVAIDFDATTQGVLDAFGVNFSISPDTAICPGESAQLFASGGEVYQWFPEAGLSCENCPNPVATVSQTTVYSVAIYSTCVNDTLEVEVGLLQVDAGPDLTVCLGEELELSAGSNFTGVNYSWTGPAGFLSCTDCANPVLTAASAGTFTFSVTAAGPTCSFSDEMTLTVLPQPAPSYQISDDLQICLGETVAIGGPTIPGVVYSWTSNPPGLFSNESNPSLTPSETTLFFLEVSNTACPFPSFDSVLVEVSEIPIVNVANDTTICLGESVTLGATQPESGVNYSWSPTAGLSNPNIANPIATPGQTTQYTLTADRIGCITEESVTVTVTEIGVNITTPDTSGICRGTSVPIQASAFPAGITINWIPNDGSLNTTTGTSVVATPQTATSYIAFVEVPGCIKMDTAYIGVDSLPYDLAIVPADTQICQGEQVLLVSQTYEPADFSQITFQWSPSQGQLTPDSLFNMVVQPNETTTYQRIASNGFCQDTSLATVVVIGASSITVEPSQPVICEGGQVELTATSPVPISFTWEPAAGLSCADCPNPTANPSVTTTYTITGEYEGCPVGGSVTVEVTPEPEVVFPVNVVCPGESITLNLAPNGNYSYQWTSGDQSLTSTEPAPVVAPATTTTYYVSLSNGTCPPVTDSITVFVPSGLTLEVSNDTTVCGINPVTLTADGGVPGTYSWQPTNEQGPMITPPLELGINTFTVTFTDAGGCFTLTETVEVEAVSGIQILDVNSDRPDTVYQGTLVTLGVETSIPAASWQWSSGSTSDTMQVRPFILPSETYSVTVTDALGCTDVDSKTIHVLPSLWDIPNVFTPNGDEHNAVFNVVITGENIEVLSIQIWNRWGQLVYEEKNGNAGWDGMQKGEAAPSDVYLYQIRLREPNGNEVKRSGDVTLLR